MRILIVVAVALAACSPAADGPVTSTSVAVVTATVPTTLSMATTTTASTATASNTRTGERAWYLVSVTASLPEGFSADIETITGVSAVTTASVGTLDLVMSSDASGVVIDAAPEGYTFPLEAQTFNPQGRSGFVPQEIERVLDALGPREAILSETSAEFRQLGPGGELHLDDGTRLLIVGVVADEWVGGAEVVISNADAGPLGITNERYSVVLYNGDKAGLELAVISLAEGASRVRSRDEVDMFRHADAVASQLAVKVRYGEFAYLSLTGGAIEIDPAWVDANILHEHIPLLGGITCHKDFVAMLRDVMTTLDAAGHGDVIDRSAYKGCWNPRFIRKRTDLSHHAWGVAADINFGNDPDGPGSPTDQRLLGAMAALDILSGHAWTDPDPGHFEWFPRNG